MRWWLRVAALALPVAPAVAAGCAEDSIEVDVRSLGRSGQVSFVCLDDPALGAAAARPLSDCQTTITGSADDYSVPHLYAVVTQLTSGEVALIDLTTNSEVDDVVDQNSRVPGANFLPVGAQPVDIVSTPGSTATFVAVGEVGRQGIFAIPSTMLRPQGRAEQPTLSSWPACSLGSITPGEMLVVADAPGPDGGLRESCDAGYGPPGGGTAGNPDSTNRQKLLVVVPDEAAIAVIDAQSLLARAPGSFDACTIERWVPLQVKAGTVPPAEAFEVQAGCVNPEPPQPEPMGTESRPAGMTLAGNRLYVADLEAPVIHVLDMPSPCDLTEREPLLPTSMRDPERAVTTSRLAATPGSTKDFKRFLYAVDDIEGSVMAFDISDEGAAPRTPVRRPNAERDPLSFPDRVRFNVPVRDIVMIRRDVAIPDENGVTQSGVECDPTSKETLGSKYQTSDTYEVGAQPGKLRGTFAFLLLASGQIAIVDIEDYDEKCRKPRQPLALLGCDDELPPPDAADRYPVSLPYASNESSCNMVTEHTPRAARFFTWEDEAGSDEPGLQTYPRLTDGNGKTIGDEEVARPRMRALVPNPDLDVPPFSGSNTGLGITVGSERLPISNASGLVSIENEPTEFHDTLAMNLEEPHVHAGQHWRAVFEGALPGFGNHYGELRIGAAFPTDEGLYDATARFCDLGVQSYAALLEIAGEDPEAESFARTLADRVVIASELPSEASPHWDVAACSFQTCTATFGSNEVPTLARDLPILEAYQDHVSLGSSLVEGVLDEDIKCCFPGVVSFEVRPAQQWVVEGERSGFLHRVIEDPATGVCRNSCDPRLALRNGRVRFTEPGTVFADVTPDVFLAPGIAWGAILVNPLFRFSISRCTLAEECGLVSLLRDTSFDWDTTGGFETLAIGLSEDLTILPSTLSVNPANGQLAVTDGSFQGLILVDTATLEERRTYF